VNCFSLKNAAFAALPIRCCYCIGIREENWGRAAKSVIYFKPIFSSPKQRRRLSPLSIEESEEEEPEAAAAAGRALFSRIKSSFCYKIFFALL
jgi:hypothetical protein